VLLNIRTDHVVRKGCNALSQSTNQVFICYFRNWFF